MGASISSSSFTLADFDRAYGANIDNMGTRSLDDARFTMRLDDSAASAQNALPARRATVQRVSENVTSSDAFISRRAVLVRLDDAFFSEDAGSLTILTAISPNEASLSSVETLNLYRQRRMDVIEAEGGTFQEEMDIIYVVPLVINEEIAFSDEFDSIRRRMVAFSDEAALDSDAALFFRFGMGPCAGDVISDESIGYENRRPIAANPEEAVFQDDGLLLFYAGREWGRSGATPVTAWGRQSDEVSAWVRAAEKRTLWTHTPGVREVMVEERR